MGKEQWLLLTGAWKLEKVKAASSPCRGCPDWVSRGQGAEVDSALPFCASFRARGPVQLLPEEELPGSPVLFLCNPHHGRFGPVHDRWDDGEPSSKGMLY